MLNANKCGMKTPLKLLRYNSCNLMFRRPFKVNCIPSNAGKSMNYRAGHVREDDESENEAFC